jgi:hypothetical protein
MHLPRLKHLKLPLECRSYLYPILDQIFDCRHSIYPLALQQSYNEIETASLAAIDFKLRHYQNPMMVPLSAHMKASPSPQTSASCT